jgi:lysophospholipase L1-like esterase
MIFNCGDKIVFIGDSISDYERKRPVGEGLFNAWGRSYIADVGALLCSAYPELRLRVVSMGVDGDQVRDLARRWQTDVMDLRPDWVAVHIGINDVWRQFDSPTITEEHVTPDEYRSTYEKLIESTLPSVKGMILMAPYFMEPNRKDPMRARMDEYGAVVRALAVKHGLMYVDLQSAWDRLFEHMHPCNIAWDRIHPNQVGCMFIARQFLAAVGFDR